MRMVPFKRVRGSCYGETKVTKVTKITQSKQSEQRRGVLLRSILLKILLEILSEILICSSTASSCSCSLSAQFETQTTKNLQHWSTGLLGWLARTMVGSLGQEWCSTDDTCGYFESRFDEQSDGVLQVFTAGRALIED